MFLDVSLTILGTVYEKRLIEAFISENGTEPTTGAALTTEDLLELKTQPNVTPRPPQLTSVPAMLAMFQNEWDSMALQVYKLQQDLKEARRELSVAMYQQDAARRVIAKVAAERDEARAALSKVSVGRGAPSGDAMEVDNAPLPDSILGKIDSEQARYDRLFLGLLMRETDMMKTACPRPDESGQCPKSGLPQNQYLPTCH